MTTNHQHLSIGDVLEGLQPDELRISPALGHQAPGGAAGRTLADGTPTNAQILDAARRFYADHQQVVDGTTYNTRDVARTQPGYVQQVNGYNWNDQRLTSDEQGSTDTAIFGADGSGGLWGPTLDDVKADRLFTTIGVGVSADLQFFVGGAGGLGCVWDIAKREGPRGYGYATGELGIRITASLNAQCVIFNQLPSDLNTNVYGLKVSLDLGISLSFQTFFTDLTDLTILGFGIGAGVGIGGGASVFGGHIWNFG